MDKMSQLLKLLEKTDYIEINEFRMDFEELELQFMPAMQRVVQQAATKQAAVQETLAGFRRKNLRQARRR